MHACTHTHTHAHTVFPRNLAAPQNHTALEMHASPAIETSYNHRNCVDFTHYNFVHTIKQHFYAQVFLCMQIVYVKCQSQKVCIAQVFIMPYTAMHERIKIAKFFLEKSVLTDSHKFFMCIALR